MHYVQYQHFLFYILLFGGAHAPNPPPAYGPEFLTINAFCPNGKSVFVNTHTHTHTFNGPLTGTTRVSRYQKGKTSLDFTEARDSEWQWHQLGHMQVCTSLQTDNHISTPPLSFLQAGCPSCHPTNSVKALKANFREYLNVKISALYTTLPVRNYARPYKKSQRPL